MMRERPTLGSDDSSAWDLGISLAMKGLLSADVQGGIKPA